MLSRVTGPDKETSSKAETVKETTIKQKEKKHTHEKQHNHHRPRDSNAAWSPCQKISYFLCQTPFLCSLMVFWMLNASRNHTTSEVLESFMISLFCCVFWGRGLFCFISESKDNRNLNQKNLHQIYAFTYQTIFLKAKTSCLGMLLIRLLTCLGLKTTFSPSKHTLPVFSASFEPAQPKKHSKKTSQNTNFSN